MRKINMNYMNSIRYMLLISAFCKAIMFVNICANNALSNVSNNVSDNRLRILFTLDQFPGHTKIIIMHQMNTLIEHGHDVAIFARKKTPELVVEPELSKYDLLSRTYYEKLPGNLKSYDIVMCQYGDEGKWLVPVLKKNKFKGKLVTCIRGGDITSQKNLAPHAYDDLFKYGDLFLPVCEYLKDRLISLGCPVNKIKVLHSAIDCSQFKFKERVIRPDKKITIVSVGRLVEGKGFEFAIKAIKILVRTYKNIEYVIVGDGSMRQELTSLIRRLGVEKYVTLLGWRSQEHIKTLLTQADLFILPCVTAQTGTMEGIPNALKEAMSCGLPVVSTDHSGNKELIIDGVSGFLVPERSIRNLTRRITYLIEHPEQWSSMGIAGRDMIERQFEKNKISQQLGHIMTDLVASKKNFLDSV